MARSAKHFVLLHNVKVCQIYQFDISVFEALISKLFHDSLCIPGNNIQKMVIYLQIYKTLISKLYIFDILDISVIY
jgi:hypothetical protein